MIATGIENSYPTIALPDGRIKRVDSMAKSDHYRRWREDFEKVKELGIGFLRYGPPYYQVHQGPGSYDWAFADETFHALREMGITPIADLCHFGLPDWLGSFQNPDFPRHFAEYARAFAERYPWVHLFTPVNEIFVTALFSARFGWWNERLQDERAFVTAIKHLCQANVLAMRAIALVRPGATFIQSEVSEYSHAEDPECLAECRFLNEKRFLALDLTYGYPISATMFEYLLANGFTTKDYHWFAQHRVKANCIIGTDYYETNELLVSPDRPTTQAGDVFGYYILCRQYFDRYRLPIMHTETNMAEPRSVAWLRKQAATMVRLKQDGIPIVGFTWYSLTDQVDWDTCLREDNGRVNPLGLYDLDRKIRPVGEMYRALIQKWEAILATDSIVLTLGY
ncbi:family 1 glycosylhydrolase [Geminicoccus sp.]|uniref:family 1 glycosylhydrolase n=1 Tax=Geminicoccus sp. TaxID=2024832 RepID=UPI0032C21A05